MRDKCTAPKKWDVVIAWNEIFVCRNMHTVHCAKVPLEIERRRVISGIEHFVGSFFIFFQWCWALFRTLHAKKWQSRENFLVCQSAEHEKKFKWLFYFQSRREKVLSSLFVKWTWRKFTMNSMESLLFSSLQTFQISDKRWERSLAKRRKSADEIIQINQFRNDRKTTKRKSFPPFKRLKLTMNMRQHSVFIKLLSSNSIKHTKKPEKLKRWNSGTALTQEITRRTSINSFRAFESFVVLSIHSIQRRSIC